MPKANLRWAVLCCGLLGLVLTRPVAASTTIMKFGFGSDPGPDIQMLDGILSTLDDGDMSSSGSQNTGLDFVGFLSSIPSIPVAAASISIDGVTLSDDLSQVGGLFLQPTTGGSFSIWDDADMLLLSGTFGTGMLTGVVGGPATGSLISLDFGTFDGGSLASMVDVNSAALSLSFAGVNDGLGFSISGGETPRLDNFMTDSTGLIAASVPEPMGASLLCASGLGLVAFCRRRLR